MLPTEVAEEGAAAFGRPASRFGQTGGADLHTVLTSRTVENMLL